MFPVFDFCAIAYGPQNKDFGAVSRTVLTRINFLLLRRLMLKVLLLLSYNLFNSTNKRSFLGIMQGFAEVRVWNRKMKMGLKSSVSSEDGLEFCQRKNTLTSKQYRSTIMGKSFNLHVLEHCHTTSWCSAREQREIIPVSSDCGIIRYTSTLSSLEFLLAFFISQKLPDLTKWIEERVSITEQWVMNDIS